jgi:hypothetical protein
MEYGDITRQNESVQNPLPVIIFISRDNTLADGNQAITGVGFKPSYVHFQYSESPGTTASGGVGFARGTATQHQSYLSWNTNTADTIEGSSTRCVRLFQGSSNGNNASLVSFDSDGLTLSWVKNGSPTNFTSMRIICFK